MTVIPIYIAREELELGMFASDDALEMLEAGFLLPADVFWTDDVAAKRPLAQLKTYLASLHPTLLEKLRTTVFATAGTVVGGAAVVAGKVSHMAGQRKAELDQAKTLVLEGYLPKIREAVVTKLKQASQSAESVLRDEVFMGKLFGAVYDTSPKPVRRFVSEEVFVAFCFKHRNRVMGVEGGH